MSAVQTSSGLCSVKISSRFSYPERFLRTLSLLLVVLASHCVLSAFDTRIVCRRASVKSESACKNGAYASQNTFTLSTHEQLRCNKFCIAKKFIVFILVATRRKMEETHEKRNNKLRKKAKIKFIFRIFIKFNGFFLSFPPRCSDRIRDVLRTEEWTILFFRRWSLVFFLSFLVFLSLARFLLWYTLRFSLSQFIVFIFLNVPLITRENRR